MSSSVSQIDYWINGRSKDSYGFNASEGGPGARFLSYKVFLGLSVLGGFLALDHLYLRSPLTFIAKLIINIMFLGIWWLYDASQAIFNTDVVKVFGLGVPGLGPKGIGAGVLASEVPDQKHMSFFFYGLALFFGGIFGLDSFLVGDTQSGFIRLVSLITIIGAPIAIFWWLYNLFFFVFKTKDVTDQYSDYFGSPTPSYMSMLGQKLVSSIPILGPLFATAKKVTNAAEKTIETVGDVAEGIIQNPNITLAALQKTAPVLQPIANTVKLGFQTADTAVSTVKEGIELGKMTVEKGSALADHAITTAGETAKAASKALSLFPSAASLGEDVTVPAVKKVLSDMPIQSGGGDAIGFLPYVFVGTLGLIAVSGFIVTYLRSKKNVSPRKDDSPPEPGILRKSDQEKSTRST